jgi:hypothetical protein
MLTSISVLDISTQIKCDRQEKCEIHTPIELKIMEEKITYITGEKEVDFTINQTMI